MTQLHTKVKLYLGRDYKDSEIELQNDGEGTYIKFWSDSLEKTKPTDEQLDALSSQAETLENNAIAVANRQKEYGSIAEQLEYITENGLEAWQSKVQEIKTKYPKESE